MTYQQYLDYSEEYDCLSDCLSHMRDIEAILEDNDDLRDDHQGVENIIRDWESRVDYLEEMVGIGERKYGYDEVI